MPSAEAVLEEVEAEIEAARDSDRLIGVVLEGGKQLVTHAVISPSENEEGNRRYCRPEMMATEVDFNLAAQVTCSMCKEKLKTELTQVKRGGRSKG